MFYFRVWALESIYIGLCFVLYPLSRCWPIGYSYYVLRIYFLCGDYIILIRVCIFELFVNFYQWADPEGHFIITPTIEVCSLVSSEREFQLTDLTDLT